MLAYEIQKITKTFGAIYWNRLGWIETEEADRDRGHHSNRRWSEKHNFFTKKLHCIKINDR